MRGSPAHRGLCALAALVSAGCAAGQPRAHTPERQEIVIDEAAVVQVRRARAGEGGVPPLPKPLAHSSQAFQRGFAHAQALLGAPGPSAPPESADEAASKAWLDAQFSPWLERRLSAIVELVEAFAAMAPDGRSEPPHEHVVAVALLGLVNGRTYDQLAAIPAPAHVRADPALLRVYQSELHTTLAGGLLEAAIVAHRRCAAGAAEQREPAFGPWLELCHEQLSARLAQQSQALALLETVQAERAAERAAAEGPRPPGPDVCWTPPAVDPLLAAAQHTAQPSAAASAANATPRSCALDPAAVDPLAQAELSARDLRYGRRDPESGVRVSAALGENPTMDARPLTWIATQSRLARCFAKHVREDEAITLSVHANLSIAARGTTQSVTLTPEPSDAAAAPNKTLARCLSRALEQTAFACSASGQPTQARATFCLRRD